MKVGETMEIGAGWQSRQKLCGLLWLSVTFAGGGGARSADRATDQIICHSKAS